MADNLTSDKSSACDWHNWINSGFILLTILGTTISYCNSRYMNRPKIQIEYRNDLSTFTDSFDSGWVLQNKGNATTIEWATLSVDGTQVETWSEAMSQIGISIDSINVKRNAPEIGEMYDSGDDEILFAVKSGFSEYLAARRGRFSITVVYCSTQLIKIPFFKKCWRAVDGNQVRWSEYEKSQPRLRRPHFEPKLVLEQDTFKSNTDVRVWLEDENKNLWYRRNAEVQYQRVESHSFGPEGPRGQVFANIAEKGYPLEINLPGGTYKMVAVVRSTRSGDIFYTVPFTLIVTESESPDTF